MAYKDDAKNSARNFINIVYPKLCALGWLSGELVSAEDMNASDAMKAMDMEHGIDYINITPDDEYEGIASRVECAGTAYNTFTVRCCRAGGIRDNTEFEKTKRHITNCEKYPMLTVHVYLTKPVDGELLSVGMANTTDIYDAISAGRCAQRNNPADGCEFYSIKWCDVPCKTWMSASARYDMWLEHCAKVVVL